MTTDTRESGGSSSALKTPPCNYNAPGTCAQCGCGLPGDPRCDFWSAWRPDVNPDKSRSATPVGSRGRFQIRAERGAHTVESGTVGVVPLATLLHQPDSPPFSSALAVSRESPQIGIYAGGRQARSAAPSIWRLEIFPVGPFGRASTSMTWRGYL